MGIDRIASPVDMAVSGLRAESLRMNVIANNIANSNTANAGGGQPYRRQVVTLGTDPNSLSGVTVQQIVGDNSTDFKQMYEPGDPGADSNGNVKMPNVDLPVEMMQMAAANPVNSTEFHGPA